MLMSVADADARESVGVVCGWRCLEKPCRSPYSALHAPADCKGEEATFAMVSMTADSQLRKSH